MLTESNKTRQIDFLLGKRCNLTTYFYRNRYYIIFSISAPINSKISFLYFTYFTLLQSSDHPFYLFLPTLDTLFLISRFVTLFRIMLAIQLTSVDPIIPFRLRVDCQRWYLNKRQIDEELYYLCAEKFINEITRLAENEKFLRLDSKMKSLLLLPCDSFVSNIVRICY